MKYRAQNLLDLVHRHLLQNGYARSARELQIESGEKFKRETKVSLKEIYKLWLDKESESRNQNGATGKKTPVRETARSCESSDNKDKAHSNGADLVATTKKGSAKKAAKVRLEPVTPKKMNSAKKSATKVKGAVKTETPSQNYKLVAETPAALAKSSEESDSDEMVTSKAVPIQEPALLSTPGAGLKSKTTNHKSAPAKKTPTAAAKNRLSTFNGKSAAKDDTGESSDETDIEKKPAAMTPLPSSVKASKGKTRTPSTPAQPKADTSESSESESEEEPEKQKMQTTPATPQVKAAKTTAAQAKATKGKSITKATEVTAVSKGSPAVGKTPAKMLKDERNELVPTTPKRVTTSSIQALKQKLQSRPGALQSKADDRSSSSESESEEEHVSQNQKTASPKKGTAAASSQTSKPNTVLPAAAESSESSGDSDSESEVDTPQKSTIVASNVRTPVPSAKQPLAASPKKSRSPPPAPADDTSESGDSDSDEDTGPKKTGSQLQTSAIKAPSTGDATANARTPLQKAAPAADSSESENSDSDEEPGNKKMTSPLPSTGVKTPATGAKPAVKANATAGRAPPKADDSSETDSSDSDEDQGAKTPASPLRASGMKTPSTVAKQTAAAKAAGEKARTPLPADDSSETEDSDTYETPVKASTPAMGAAKGLPMAKSTALTPASLFCAAAVRPPTGMLVDETSEDSDSDDEPSSAVKASGPATGGTPLVKPSAATTARVPDSDADSESSSSSDSEDKGKIKITTMASLHKPAATPSAGPPSATNEKTPATGKVTAIKTSETSDDSDEDLPPAQASLGSLTPKLMATKLSQQPEVAAKSKAQSPARTVTDTKTAAAAEESSDSESDSSDSEETPAGTLRTNVTALAKPKWSIQTPLLTSTPSIALPAKSPKAVGTAQGSVTQSNGQGAKKVRAPAQTSKAAVKKGMPKAAKVEVVKSAGRGKAAVALKQAAATMSSDSSDSDSSDEKSATVIKPVSVQTKLESFFVKRIITPARNNAASKQPTQLTTSSSETSGGDEQPVVKAATPAAATKTPQKKLSDKALKTPGSPRIKVTSPNKAASGVKPMAAESSSEASDSEDDLVLKAKKAATPAAAAPKTLQKKLSDKALKTPGSPKIKVTSPTKAASGVKPTAAESSSEASDSEDDLVLKAKKAAAAAAANKTPQKKLSDKALKTPDSPKIKVTSPTKAASGVKPTAAESSSEASDSEDDLVLKKKMASQEAAAATNAKVLGAELSKPAARGKDNDDSSTSEREESQSVLQVQSPKKRKLTLDKQTKKSITKPSKKKPKAQAQPETATPCAPTTPEALLESEEETVLALLEGRSPKKAKKKSSKKIAATPMAQVTNALEKSFPTQTPSTGKKGKREAKSPAGPELGQSSVKKSGKKRKSSSEDGDYTPKAKKAKKERKVKAAGLAEEAATPTSSKKKKNKSEKEKKKKDKKQNKANKKLLLQSTPAPVRESIDSGVGLQSKHKKKNFI